MPPLLPASSSASATVSCLGGMVLGAPTVIGLSVSGASLVSELSHDFILTKIKPNASLADFEARALAPALTAAATIGAAYLTIGPVTHRRGPSSLRQSEPAPRSAAPMRTG